MLDSGTNGLARSFFPPGSFAGPSLVPLTNGNLFISYRAGPSSTNLVKMTLTPDGGALIPDVAK